MESLKNSKKRIGIKMCHRGKGAADCTDLITTNTAYQSQCYIPIKCNSSSGKHSENRPKKKKLLSKPWALELSALG